MRKRIRKLLSCFICASMVITSMPGTAKAGETGEPPLSGEQDGSVSISSQSMTNVDDQEIEAGQMAGEFIAEDEGFAIDETGIATVANALKAGQNGINLLSTNDDFEIDGTTLVKYTGSDTTVVIPDGIEKIDDRVFCKNNYIEEVVIPDSVTTLGIDVFYDTTRLKKITIGAGLANIERDDNNDAYLMYIRGLEEFIVSEQNERFYSIDGVLFDKTNNTLLMYPPQKQGTQYVVPDTTERIGPRAFENNTFIEEITLPDSVTAIRKMAFAYASNLRIVHIGSGLSGYFTCMFTGTLSLETIDISPDNPYYYTDDGVMRQKKDGAVLFYPGGKKDKVYRIPDGVKSISMAWNPYLEKLIITKDVSEVDLEYTDGLKEIEIEPDNNNFKLIGNALYDYNLTEIVRYVGLGREMH